MAAGIAVRAVAPLLRDKLRDPAVVVLDQAGRFAVPILSGHVGGANDLAREVGRLLGATPVLTTATDVAGTPAIEVWAREKGLRWDDRGGVAAVNAAWANGDPVGAYADPPFAGLLDDLRPHLALATADEAEAGAFGGVLFGVTPRCLPQVGAALWLRPPCLCAGVGCRKGADPGTVEEGVRAALAEAHLSPLAVAEVVSVDDKAAEPALLELARSLGVPFRTFPAAALRRIPVPTPSRRVAEAVGTESVSEAAALLAASGGSLLLPKVKGKTWTLSVAQRT
jgi:cobalamin biosynthesis protein CbiG